MPALMLAIVATSANSSWNIMGSKGKQNSPATTKRLKSLGKPAPSGDRLKKCLSDLETTQKELESFCYSVSHDLRAPLRSIDGFSTALLNEFGEKLEPAAREYLKRIVDSSRKMSALIDELLALSRIQRAELEPEDLNLSTLAASIMTRLKGAAPERAINFSVQPDLRARADRKLVTILLEQLLKNAIKFTGRIEQPHIEFGQIRRSEGKAFFVRDNGVGFNPVYEAKLFKLFQRLHSSSDYPGLGAGLALVRAIVLRHCGQSWAQGAVDEGATYFFTLE
jgi:light-regulated signal transduction histidine kinase (bacteriophytochrome)